MVSGLLRCTYSISLVKSDGLLSGDGSVPIQSSVGFQQLLLFVEKARCLFISVFIERQTALYYCVVVMSIKVKDMRRVPDFEVQEL